MNAINRTRTRDFNRIESEGLDEYLTRMADSITGLEALSDTHKIWFTHKNPYGCWICDTFEFTRQIVFEIQKEEQAFLNRLSPQASESITDED